jgi:D-glycerate 3-kinase
MGRANPDLVDLIGRLIVEGQRNAFVARPPLIAVVGAQGSGKTTLARAAAEEFGGVQISIDDVYLTKARREAMAEDIHPLFLTRGPPGTHDLKMLSRLLKSLTTARAEDKVLLPEFDKREDDRRPIRDWRIFEGRPKAILVDAWCLGALPEEEAALVEPVNALERDHDPDGTWRRAVNGHLAGSYADFIAGFDAVLFLKAPSFDVVLDWRCQQEADLLGVAPARLPAAERARLAGFIQYFERITRHMLDGGVRADEVVQLDRNRRPGSMPA